MNSESIEAGSKAVEALYKAMEYQEKLAIINGEVEHHVATKSHLVNIAAIACDGYDEALARIAALEAVLRECEHTVGLVAHPFRPIGETDYRVARALAAKIAATLANTKPGPITDTLGDGK